MSDRDNITLPREVAQQILEALDSWRDAFPREWGGNDQQDLEALYAALAAPHPETEKERAETDTPARRVADPEKSASATPEVYHEPTHPGYIIGSHWLETAYSRICAGEAEADVLRDCGWERVTDAEALRREDV